MPRKPRFADAQRAAIDYVAAFLDHAGVEGAEAATPHLMRGPLKRFPAPRFRLAVLRAASIAYGLADRLI